MMKFSKIKPIMKIQTKQKVKMSKFQTDPRVHPTVRAQRIIALSGPPAVGKSTTVKQIQKVFTDAGLPAPPVVSPDTYIYEEGIYNWTPQRANLAWRKAYRKLENVSCTTTDNPVILWDSTLTTPKSRIQLLSNFGHLCRAGSSFELVHLPSPGFATLVSRNEERTPDRQVPMDVMQRMYGEWMKADNFPTTREGWKKIWTSVDTLIADLDAEIIEPLRAAKKANSLDAAASEISLSNNDFIKERYLSAKPKPTRTKR
jgi:tRNA uridine 5-carbamoylmethylation protein Kti12